MDAEKTRAGGFVESGIKGRMSTLSSPTVRGKSWVFQVTALCIVLGALLALSFKTQRQAVKEGVPNRLPALRAAFRVTKQENVDLQKELAYYKDQYEDLAAQQASGLHDSEGLRQTLTDNKFLAGTISARGPGITVTLRDSPKLNPSETDPETIENYVVHDSDIRSIVDELFASGAEAISINDQRLIANSSIRCVGPVVLVNSIQLAPPYVIKAIGKADVMEKALTLPGGVADALFLLDMIDVKKSQSLVVPAFTGKTRFEYAKPVEESKSSAGRNRRN